MSTSTPRIQVADLVKGFTRADGAAVRAIDHVTLDVPAGEFLVLLGPSGCGKTTLLRSIAGLETPDAGRIVLNGTPVFDGAARLDVAPERRPASMVFQSYALWPHMSVFENVSYPLASRHVPKQELRARTTEVLELVGIGELGGQYPAQLSGGQQQRVALARAIVAAREVVLFDEPLSNVDAKVRDQLRVELLRMQRELGFTALYVTHDQEEAMTLGTRIAVLREGRIAQLGTPREIYERPASPYVADFVGTVDRMPGKVIGREGREVVVRTAGGQTFRAEPRTEVDVDVDVMARPERWELSSTEPAGGDAMPGVVEASVFLGGSRTEYIVQTKDGAIRVWQPYGSDLDRGSRVWLRSDPSALMIFGTAA